MAPNPVRGLLNGDRHRPSRPSWICFDDGYLWPCADARKRLAAVLDGGGDVLAIHMLHLMVVAARDLGTSNPASLYSRFVAWTLPVGVKCRICGRNGHDLLSGAPPRLFPWADAHARILARPALRVVEGTR